MTAISLQEESVDEEDILPSRKRVLLKSFSNFSHRFAKNKTALAGLVIVLGFVLFAFFPEEFTSINPALPNYTHTLLPPSYAHLFGTDNLGRDIFSRIVYGSKVSLEVGFTSGLLMTLIGVLTGVLGGYFGGFLDKFVTTITDFTLMIPIVPLILVIIALFGGSLTNVILVIGLTGWPQVTRVVRAETLSLKKRDFVDAARTSGVGNVKIMLNHIIPNEMSVILVNAALGISFGILAEAAIDFLGLGSVQISWGFMLFTSLSYWLSGAWWLTLFPGLAIFLASLAFYLVSEGISDAFA
ncbi:MAG: ABC transporter permease [Nitrososphaerales archaeon]